VTPREPLPPPKDVTAAPRRICLGRGTFETVGFGLQAPAAVPVEVRAARRRVFRLSRAVGEEGVRLERPAPFEPGEEVELRLVLPDGDETLSLRAVIELSEEDLAEGGARGGSGLRLIEPPHEARRALDGYVKRRLGLRH
jgi:PilZ domain